MKNKEIDQWVEMVITFELSLPLLQDHGPMLHVNAYIKVKKGKYEELIQSGTTPDPGYQ